MFVSWSSSCLCERLLSSHTPFLWRLAPVVPSKMSSFASMTSTGVNEDYRCVLKAEQPFKCQRAKGLFSAAFKLSNQQQSVGSKKWNFQVKGKFQVVPMLEILLDFSGLQIWLPHFGTSILQGQTYMLAPWRKNSCLCMVQTEVSFLHPGPLGELAS